MGQTISIFTRTGNKLQQIGGTSDELRYRRMSKKLSMFFDLIKHDSRYAKNNKSKGKYLPVFITLTYKSQKDWKQRDVSDLLAKYRKHFTAGGKKALMPKKDFRYVWVAELQKRGVVHYHVCVWLPRFIKLGKPDDLGWWTKGHSNVTAVKKSVFAYLKKYLSKGATQGLDEDGNEVWHTFPRGCRLYGGGGLTRLERIKTAYVLLPNWVKAIFIDDSSRVKKVKGGYKQNKTFLMSPYRIIENGDWRDIIYDKKFSIIEDKENEIEWDRKVKEDHRDTWYFSPFKIIKPNDSEWVDVLLKGT